MDTSPLIDSFGRAHDNLRISVTDRCNIRCFYCMPETGVQFTERSEILSFEEMIALVRGHGGIYPELKSPPLYTGRGVDMEKLFVAVVKKHLHRLMPARL